MTTQRVLLAIAVIWTVGCAVALGIRFSLDPAAFFIAGLIAGGYAIIRQSTRVNDTAEVVDARRTGPVRPVRPVNSDKL